MHQIISFHICVLLIFIHNVADPGCLSRIQNPGSDFYHTGSQILDPDPHQSAKVFLTQKSDTKFSKIRFGMFIPPRIPDPDPVVKKAKKPDPDPQHCLYIRVAQRKLTETDGEAFYATNWCLRPMLLGLSSVFDPDPGQQLNDGRQLTYHPPRQPTANRRNQVTEYFTLTT
jgi:hypothetical protein